MNNNVPVDVYCSWCYSWQKLYESRRMVLAHYWMLYMAYNLESNKGAITMTENETIKVLVTQKQCIDKSSSGQCKINCGDCKKNIPIAYQEKSYEVAISALKEIQQYRKIGTVEECREAVWKQKPKKKIYPKTALERYYHAPECPNCKRELKPQICGYTLPQAIGIYSYCPWCGQNLEGGEESEGE